MTQPQIDTIRKEIARMDARGGTSGRDSLIHQIDAAKRVIVPYNLNMPQSMFVLELEKPYVKEINFEGGRGVGKTTMEGILIDKLVTTLPRSQTLIVAPTYQKFVGDEMPSLQLSLERLGYFENLHYVVGRDFPSSWNLPRAYQQPKSLEHVIKFWNGAILRIVSLDVAATARGLNADAQLKTEAAYLNHAKLEANIGPAVRGSNDAAFAGLPYYGIDANFSSTPLTAEGRWFIDREVSYFLEQEAIEYAKKHRKKVPPQTKSFVKGATIHNLHNLMHGYLAREQEKAANMTIFNAEYWNIRPAVVENAFYSLLNEKVHAYTPERGDDANLKEGVFTDCRHDADHDPESPLLIGVDFGSRQNCASINQLNPLINELTTIKEFFALGAKSEKQEDLAIKIDKYYKPRQNKQIYLYYDHYGNIEWGHTKLTLAEQLRASFEELGWTVQLMTRGSSNPLQNLKYRMWQIIHSEETYPNTPRHRINKTNAHNTWVAMTLAQTEEKRDGSIGKNKRVEKSKTLKEETKTDITDALDCLAFDIFGYLLEHNGGIGAGSAYGVK